MTTGAVTFDRVWKKFRSGEVHDRIRDLIPSIVARSFSRHAPPETLVGSEFWALQGVSFDLGPGDALGIIGPNGAGKSTILKLLTRILRPTRGRCVTRGRVGALIEVAAGFHPDLTGRENVYLQGAIMGMPKREIVAKFDEIVAFSEIEWFIDTPVKRYSSGMHARLGFSIAAHLDPDVLIIDEAISVGDLVFQRKAFERIRTLVQGHIPVVVVSHQLDAIATLCTEAILLQGGVVAKRGSPRDCIAAYLHESAERAPSSPTGPVAIRIDRLEVEPTAAVASGGWSAVRIDCGTNPGVPRGSETVGVRIRSGQSGEALFETTVHQLGGTLPAGPRFGAGFDLQLNTQPGVYAVETFVCNTIGGREIVAGPTAYIEVQGGTEFQGTIQFNPVLRLREETGI